MEASANELVMISGKSKELCLAALRASNGDPDVAFEILSGNIPLDEGSYEGADD
jgi:hypothetical protein